MPEQEFSTQQLKTAVAHRQQKNVDELSVSANFWIVT